MRYVLLAPFFYNIHYACFVFSEYLPELRPCIVRFLSAVITITKATPAPVWFLKHLADVITMRRDENEKWTSGRVSHFSLIVLLLIVGLIYA